MVQLYRMLFDRRFSFFFYTTDFDSNVASKFVAISYDAILSFLATQVSCYSVLIVTFHCNIILELLRFIFSILLTYNFSSYYLNK